jgi:hypothetical protein
MSSWPSCNEDFQVGDLVFIRISNFLYRRVAEATNSWTTHVGMIDHRADTDWIVAESTVPFSRYSPLSKFLRRTEGGQWAVLRLKAALDLPAQARLQREARCRMGKWYHLGFDLDSRHQFCSKFVYEVYQSALGVSIGSIKSFRELVAKNPGSPLNFWRIWFLGRIPWERRTITPSSQYESHLLRRVSGSVTVPGSVETLEAQPRDA